MNVGPNLQMRKILLGGVLVVSMWSPSVGLGQVSSASSQREKIDRLIQQLGAPEYATRERAQSALQRLGLEAFDALHQAQEHPDVEIAMRARYLIRSMEVDWSDENDPPRVKEILRGYGDKSTEERLNLMQRLADLDGHEGTSALCRLSRYEPSRELSKRAALLVMSQPRPTDDERRKLLVQRIQDAITDTPRSAGNWLRTFAIALDKPLATMEEWSKISREEADAFAQFPDQSSREVARDLFRWHASFLLGLEQRDESLVAIRRSINLLDGSREQLLEIADWLIEHQMWPVVGEVEQRFADAFSRSPLLLYRLAECQLRQGDEQGVEKTVSRAIGSVQGDVREHVVVGLTLQQDGLFTWAEREYLHVIAQSDPESSDTLRCRFLLAELLHDLGDELRAAREQKVIADLVAQNEEVAAMVIAEFGRRPPQVRSRYEYFMACHFESIDQLDQQRESMEAGFAADPNDVDVLIAMFRMSPDDALWQDTARERIARATTALEQDVVTATKKATTARTPHDRTSAEYELATANNQLAWLIGNTTGDLDLAIQCSRRSLELRPDTAGYLDTLGQCYYAKKDYASAVRYQTRAIELEPHSPHIKRQLKLFQEALARESGGGQPRIQK